ncbi:MAG: sigma-70 family RNA polymerase sigma factor [Planctomycetes bacterium]|nr:sigma-70 family RNA polymerase sigma factor [Planctomycetota bacterium]
MHTNPHQLLPHAYRAASQVVHNRLLAEEAGERAIHLYTLAILHGHPPEHPKAWLRSVARRSALALLRSGWTRTRSSAPDEIADRQAPYHTPPTSGVTFVREALPDTLTARQREALAAAMSCHSTRAAARTCDMQPRDFRRFLSAISRRGKRLAEEWRGGDPHANDPAVVFGLDT